MSDQDPDWTLVLSLQQGDPSALDALMERHQVPLFRYIYRYVNREEDAREITQETFVRAYFKIHQFEPKAKFVTWLYQIAMNLCRDRVRSRTYKKSIQTDSLVATNHEGEESERPLLSLDQDPSEKLEAKEQMFVLEGAIQDLAHDLKTAFVLAVLEERPHQECAEILGTSPKTVEMRVYRARKFLAEKLKKAGY